MATHRALVVDDEPDIRELLAITLARMDIECTAAANIAEAKARLNAQEFGICLTDMKLPDGNGLDLVAYMQQRYPNLPVAVITAHGNMESAIQALKSGAFDFVNKPLDINDLRNLVAQAIKAGDGGEPSRKALIGDSPGVEQLRTTIAKLARSQAPIYISGESGTGKELVARSIHEQGPRSGHEFVPVNCGAIPHELMESELFGHTKGSFTGATTDKPGLFQAANRGTLFLDEVADLPLQMQVKLLRAIQEKHIRPVGATREIPVDCRILSATHKNLADLVEAGTFRQDLFYRINVIPLHLPPLRSRGVDILAIASHYIDQFAERSGKKVAGISETAAEKLLAYSWPGNVRELRNVMERALALTRYDSITIEDLPDKIRDHQGGTVFIGGEDPTELVSLEEIERRYIEHVLKAVDQNRTQAARILGFDRKTLYRKLKSDSDPDSTT